jgi:hypothetical protein
LTKQSYQIAQDFRLPARRAKGRIAQLCNPLRNTAGGRKEATDGLSVEPNHVYVIPLNTNLGILHGTLHLMPRGDPHKQHLPVDYFLRALAEDQGTRAIGVILSGTASDGALGVKAVKAEGGITLAQDPASAKYDGMPRSAIATGGVDFILRAEGIAKELARIAGRGAHRHTASGGAHHPQPVRAPARHHRLPPEYPAFSRADGSVHRAGTGCGPLNLVKMARQDLTVELRTVVHMAIKEGTSARKEGVKLRYDGESWTVDIQVIPVQGSTAAGPHFLVLFEEASPPAPAPETAQEKKPPTQVAPSALERRVRELEDELATNKEYMQSIIEEQEATNEELSSANEEIQSANEELQSTNEELETAKEELHSTNEELATVNEELENRNLELTQANSDLNNLLRSIDLPILTLSEDLRIRRFTPQAQRLLNLIASDVGRPISDIKPEFGVPDLGKLALEVTDALSPKTAEIRDSDGPAIRCGYGLTRRWITGSPAPCWCASTSRRRKAWSRSGACRPWYAIPTMPSRSRTSTVASLLGIRARSSCTAIRRPKHWR